MSGSVAFGEKAGGTAPHALDGAFDRAVRGQNKDLGRRCDLEDKRQAADAFFVAKLQVEQDGIEVILREQVFGRLEVMAGMGDVASRIQEGLVKARDLFVVIDE